MALDHDSLWVKKLRQTGNRVATILNERYFSSVKSDLNMSFLPLRTKEFNDYWNEMQYCIDFGLCNRRLMMHRIQEVISEAIPHVEFEPMINIAHNYASWESHFGENCIIHRKGATSAREGEVGIIPGSISWKVLAILSVS